MGWLNIDQMLDEMADQSWTNGEPPGKHPVRWCDQEYPEDHTAHEWWMPELVRTRVFGNRVERTQEIAWFWCEGKVPG